MRTLLALAFVSTLLCCNNGGGNSASVAPPALASPDIEINEGNAVAAAAAGLRGSMDLLRLGYLGASFLQVFISDPAPTSPVLLSTLLSTEVAGPDGGTATFTWSDVDESRTYSSADNFTIGFRDYADERMVLNGVMTIDELRVQGLLPGDGTLIVDGTLNLVGLSVQIGQLEQVFSTSWAFRLDNRIIVEIFDLYLIESQVFGALEVQQNTLLTRQATETDIRYVLNGAVHSAELGGVLRFNTNYLIQSRFYNDPSDGSLFVEGANGSILQVLPAGCLPFLPGFCLSAEVQLDADGDGAYEWTATRTWEELLPQ